MFQRDYIMRMIEQLGLALIRVLHLKEAEKFDAAQIEIDKTGKMLLGLDMKLVRALSDSEIITLLKPADSLDTAKCIVIAELLKEEGEIFEHQQNTAGSYKNYLKSLSLFLEAFTTEQHFCPEDHFSKIKLLITRLNQYEIPPHVNRKLFHYFEATGEYAKAEDVLFQLLDKDTPGIFEEGIAYYQHLLTKTDAQLNKGNLPRDEVAEGLLSLKQKKPA